MQKPVLQLLFLGQLWLWLALTCPYDPANAAESIENSKGSTQLSVNDVPALSRFDAALVNLVRQATEARIFHFVKIAEFGSGQSVANTEFTSVGTLTGSSLEKLREQLFSPSSYQTGVPRGSCPFQPVLGFRFTHNDDEVWWLISESCKTETGIGMLTAKSTNWRESPTLVIRPDALKEFQRFNQ